MRVFLLFSRCLFVWNECVLFSRVLRRALCIRFKKDFLILVETLLLNYGLNHVIFFIYLLWFCWLMTVSLHGSFLLFPDSHKLCSYCVSDCWNNFLLEGRFDRRFSIETGICLIILGGWVGCVCMCCILSSGLWCGLQVKSVSSTLRLDNL